jgi:predicted phosphodiesterase
VPVTLGSLKGNRWRHPNGGIEERKPSDSCRVPCGELQRQSPSEAVADDVDAREAECVQRVAYVTDVCFEVPGRVPVGVPVPAEVDGDHPIPGEMLLGQTAESSAVTCDAVKAEDRWTARVAPFEHVQSHLCQRTGALSLATLYDIHGNLAALEAVLEAAEAEGVDRYLLGGDYAAFGPWPRETLERLWRIENATWIRGNGERWLIETDEVPLLGSQPEESPIDAAVRELAPSEIDRLYALPIQVKLDGVLYVHGSPRSDVESFALEPQDGEEELLGDVRDRTVVFGHSHLQFRRPGPNGTALLNPGSVGMPLDGDIRAAWAVRGDDGSFEFRRTSYDVERAVAKARELGSTWGEMVAGRLARGSD